MLEDRGVAYTYREYREEPLTAAEVRAVLKKLGLTPRDVLRLHDRMAKELGLTGSERADLLVEKMAEHPTLLQRPIAVAGSRALVARPAERLLELL